MLLRQLIAIGLVGASRAWVVDAWTLPARAAPVAAARGPADAEVRTLDASALRRLAAWPQDMEPRRLSRHCAGPSAQRVFVRSRRRRRQLAPAHTPKILLARLNPHGAMRRTKNDAHVLRATTQQQ